MAVLAFLTFTLVVLPILAVRAGADTWQRNLTTGPDFPADRDASAVHPPVHRRVAISFSLHPQGAGRTHPLAVGAKGYWI